jgi:CBS domain containing-hemolysin-like protein
MDFIVSLIILSVLIIVLIYLSGWFSGTETALTNLNNVQIAEMRRKKEKNVDYIVKAKKNMDRTLITILIGNNIVNIVLSAVAALVANELFQTIGVTIMIAMITILIIIFGEISPKSNAIADSPNVSKRNSKAIYYLMRGLNPVITFFVIVTKGLNKLTGRKTRPANILVSDDAIKDLATLGEEEGLIKPIEKEIIHKVFLFGDRKIEQIMVPFDKVFLFSEDCTVQNVKVEISKRGFTRVPVVDQAKKVVGVLYSKDLLGKTSGNCKSLMKPPFFTSSDSDITDIFNEMRKKRVHLAIVKNDNGEHIGIVTLEDIIEEIVGEIYDEYFELKYKRDLTPQEIEDNIESILKKSVA